MGKIAYFFKRKPYRGTLFPRDYLISGTARCNLLRGSSGSCVKDSGETTSIGTDSCEVMARLLLESTSRVP